MNRRNTVSVTPAIGASTVAGEILTEPIRTDEGTTTCVSTACVGRTFLSDSAGEAPAPQELSFSQNFFTDLFYLPSFRSNSASAASSICRCRGLHATCNCCKMCCRESSMPFRSCSAAICSEFSGTFAPPLFEANSSCCCSTDLLSHPRAMLPL